MVARTRLIVTFIFTFLVLLNNKLSRVVELQHKCPSNCDHT